MLPLLSFVILFISKFKYLFIIHNVVSEMQLHYDWHRY